MSCKNGVSAYSDPVNEACPAVGYQRIGICVPVTVAPYAIPGKTVTKCCGDPTITPGEVTCKGKKNATCTFTMSQIICVEVPVTFGATATVQDTYVDCLGVSEEDICTGCTADDN